jgi:ABC-type Fe3+-hydroxamate transport system substrate-binding protein
VKAVLRTAIIITALLATESAQAKQPRIVTLAPSLTEIAFAVGCGPNLVADTSYDDYPAGARSLPHVADLVNVDLERLGELHPSVVIALHDQEREAAPISSRLGVPVTYLPNRNLEDLFTDIARVGELCGTPDAAAELSRSLRGRLAAVAQQASRYQTHPRVLFLLDLPGFTAGAQSFLSDLIRLAGGVNVAGDIQQAYPDLSAESLLALDPQVMIVAKEVRFGQEIRSSEPWRSISAVKTGRVLRPPSDDILERNGPRVVDGLEWLVRSIHT